MNLILKILSVFLIVLSSLSAEVGEHSIVKGKQLSKEGMNFNKEDLKAMKKYFMTLFVLKKYYVNEYNYSTLINKSIKGLLDNLDPHTVYLNNKEFKQLKESSKGNYVGIGLVIEKTNDGKIKIIKVFKNGPAYKAGIRTGDIIVKVKGKIISNNTSLENIVNKIKGKKGTKIKITVFRPSTKKFITVNLTRSKINIPSVIRKYIKGNENILYVKINVFNKKEYPELKKIVDKYMHNKKIKNKGIIIDLRNNPGGLLNDAIKTLDLFIDKGKLLIVKGRIKKEEVYYAHKKGTYKNVPIVILVNSNSASASEVVAGAMKVDKRAIIVGTKTFGKGSVQIIIPYNKLLKDNSGDAMKLTIAKYFLPNGKSIQGEGILPDITVKQHIIENTKNSTITITENNLDNSRLIKIKPKYQYKEISKKYNVNIKNKNEILDPNKDFQLYNAVNVLKTLELYKK